MQLSPTEISDLIKKRIEGSDLSAEAKTQGLIRPSASRTVVPLIGSPSASNVPSPPGLTTLISTT